MKAETIEQKMAICGADVESKEPGLKEHSDEVEFAYHALKQFVEYCSLKPNSKEIVLTKDILGVHLNGGVTLYYRTKKYQPRTKGFGVSDKQACRQPYSEAYNVKTKCVKNKNESVAMIAYEITAPNTTEAIRIKNIVLSYFLRSYWEFTSLDQTTITVYIKIVYDVVMTRRDDVFNVCKLTETKINNILSGRGQQGRAILMSMPVLASSPDRTPMARLPRFNQDSTKTQPENASLFYVAPTYNILDTFESFNTGLSNFSHFSKDIGDLDCFSKLSDSQHTISLFCDLHRVRAHFFDNDRFNRIINKLQSSKDALKKSRIFYFELARVLNRVPEVDRALAEFERVGLASGGRGEWVERFKQIHDYLLTSFKPSVEPAFNYSGFESQEAAISKFIESRLQPGDLIYNDGRQRYLKVDKLALAFFAMRKSQMADKSNRTDFGRKNLEIAFGYSKPNSHNHEIAAIFRVLEKLGLIELVSDYIKKVKTRTFKVVQISFLPDRAA